MLMADQGTPKAILMSGLNSQFMKILRLRKLVPVRNEHEV